MPIFIRRASASALEKAESELLTKASVAEMPPRQRMYVRPRIGGMLATPEIFGETDCTAGSGTKSRVLWELGGTLRHRVGVKLLYKSNAPNQKVIAMTAPNLVPKRV